MVLLQSILLHEFDFYSHNFVVNIFSFYHISDLFHDIISGTSSFALTNYLHAVVCLSPRNPLPVIPNLIIVIRLHPFIYYYIYYEIPYYLNVYTHFSGFYINPCFIFPFLILVIFPFVSLPFF